MHISLEGKKIQFKSLRFTSNNLFYGLGCKLYKLRYICDELGATLACSITPRDMVERAWSINSALQCTISMNTYNAMVVIPWIHGISQWLHSSFLVLKKHYPFASKVIRISSPNHFKSYGNILSSEYIDRANLEEFQIGVKIGQWNINNLRYEATLCFFQKTWEIWNNSF